MKECMEIGRAGEEFLRILRDYVHGVKDSYMVDEAVLHYAKIHEVEGILYKQTEVESLSAKYAYTVYSHTNRMRLTREISDCLAEIPHVWVKGLVIAKYYPDPMLRSMGDCDLTVPLEDKKRAVKRLETQGFRFGDCTASSEWSFQKQGLNFELHHALLYGKEADETENDDFLAYFSQCWSYSEEERHELKPEFHFLYVLIHLRKHFMNKGIGIRQFLDVAILSQQDFDWKWIEEQLEELHLTMFAKTVVGLNEKWFEVPSPFSFSGEVKNEREATEMVLDAGVFGFETDDNKHLANLTMHEGKQHNLGKYIRFLFPSYAYFLRSKKYAKMIRGRPCLLPCIWVYRGLTMYQELGREKKRFFISKEEVEDRKRIYEEWGLREKE